MAVVYGNTTNHWRAYMDYSMSTSNGRVSFTVKGGFASVAWGFAINYVDCTISATGQSDTKVTNQAVNIPSRTTATRQLVSKTFNVKREKSAKTVTLKVVTYNHSGYMNGTSTVTVNVTVPAATHTVIKYDANGGTGAPANQDKYYGYQLNLSSQRPARPGYEFLSWNTAANGSGASWAPGANYTPDPGGTVTLYAQWKRSYIAPTLSGLTLQRTNESGAAAEEGTYAKVTGSWKVDTTLNSANKATGLKIEYQKSGDSAWTTAVSTNPNAASGSLSNVVGEGKLSIESPYNFRVTVSDSGGSTTASGVLSESYFIMDILEGGKGVAFGKACTQPGFHVKADTGAAITFDGPVTMSEPLPVASGGTGATTAAAARNGIAPKTKLWSGTLSKDGSVTIPDIDNWRIIGVRISLITEMLIGGVTPWMKSSATITFLSASAQVDDGSSATYKASFKKVGTTLTLLGASRHTLPTSGNIVGALASVTEIWGLY